MFEKLQRCNQIFAPHNPNPLAYETRRQNRPKKFLPCRYIFLDFCIILCYYIRTNERTIMNDEIIRLLTHLDIGQNIEIGILFAISVILLTKK